jgi:hypothetical protein
MNIGCYPEVEGMEHFVPDQAASSGQALKMTGYRLKFVGISLICSMATGACGSNGGGNGGSPPETGECPTSISDAHGANNAFAIFNSQLTGDYSGPDGSAKFSTVCLRLADVPQTLAITVMGAKPASGVTYGVTGVTADAPTGNVASIEYAEGNNGTKVWAGTSGTVQVDSVARESVGLSFAQVLMAPEAGKPANTATGTFTLSGSQRAGDVLGFAP